MFLDSVHGFPMFPSPLPAVAAIGLTAHSLAEFVNADCLGAVTQLPVVLLVSSVAPLARTSSSSQHNYLGRIGLCVVR